MISAEASLGSFHDHLPSSITSFCVQMVLMCMLDFKPEPAKLVHLGLANDVLRHKERPLHLKCSKLLVGAGAGLGSFHGFLPFSITSFYVQMVGMCRLALST